MKKQGNFEKFKRLTTDEVSPWEQEALQREADAGWQTKSAAIALQILRSLRAQKMTQSALGTKLSVSPQYVNKIVKGQENLSLETITKLEDALNTSLISIYVGEQRLVGQGPRFKPMKVVYLHEEALPDPAATFAADRIFECV